MQRTTEPTPTLKEQAEMLAGPHHRPCLGDPVCVCIRANVVAAIEAALREAEERGGEQALAAASKKSVCTYCGHITEDADAEARLASMVAHVLQCGRHPLRRMVEEVAEARRKWLEEMRERAAKAAEEHLYHVDLPGYGKDGEVIDDGGSNHMPEPGDPPRCCVANMIRALPLEGTGEEG